MPISMKMAKRQNLSLNPSKISGQCGRLMCCLSYENDQYETRKKRKETVEAEEVEAAAPSEWDDAAEDEPSPPEEELDAEMIEDVAGPGETVLVVDPDQSEPVYGDLELAAADDATTAAGASRKSRHRSRRRRKHRRFPPGDGGGGQPAGQSPS